MLSELIDQYYIEHRSNKIQNRFYLSEAGKCPRQVFFSFKKCPSKETEPNFLRLFDHGDHMHQLITKTLLNIKNIKVVATEVNIPSSDLVSGRADAIVEKDNVLYVLDIKSINSKAFDYLESAKEDNVLQVQLYLHYFGIEKGILLYVNKDNLKLKEYIIDYDKKVAESLIKDFEKLRKQIDSDEMPPRIKGYPLFWQCKYCKFKSVCDIDESNWELIKEKINK